MDKKYPHKTKIIDKIFTVCDIIILTDKGTVLTAPVEPLATSVKVCSPDPEVIFKPTAVYQVKPAFSCSGTSCCGFLSEF